MIRLNVEGEWFDVTEDHPFWNVTDAQWQPAARLAVGDRVEDSYGRTAGVRGSDLRRPRLTTTYNLTVARPHTFHVGGLGLLVHNTCTPGTTVLGHHPAYEKLAKKLRARWFNVPAAQWNRLSDPDKWSANRRFLDRLIARGDNIVLATPINAVKPGSWFERELKYLLSKGFRPVAQGRRLLPPLR